METITDKQKLRNRGTLVNGLWVVLSGLLLCATPGWAQNQDMGTSGNANIDSCKKLFDEGKTLVSLDFQKAPLADVFQVISDVSGANIVAAPKVTGDTTVMVTDVPWPVALEVVLDNSKLGRVCSDNIIRVASKESFRDLKQKGEKITEMIQLNYSNSLEVSTRVKGFMNPGGTVTVDERTSTLVVTDTRAMVEDVVAVVKNLDIPTPQVQIASKIVQVNRNFLQELGVQWGVSSLTFRNPEFPNSILVTGAATPGPQDGALRGSGGFTPANLNGQSAIGQGFLVDLSTTGSPLFGLGTSLLSRDGDMNLDLQLTALERQGRTRIIASPKVSTADNKEAKIRQGARIPFQTFSANEGTKTEFVDANLELKVTPHITADQKIYMKVDAQQNSPDFSNTVGGAPRIDTRSASTELLVEDGGTAILGGLHQRSSSENRRAVPYLADIPILGLLFKSTLERDTVDELLIFVTPSIIKNPNS